MSENIQAGMDLVDRLTDDELDAVVDYIRHTYKARQARRNATARARIEVGTRVRLAGNRKPQYLKGLTGKVVEKRQERVTIELDCGPVGKFKSGRVITQPGGLDILERKN